MKENLVSFDAGAIVDNYLYFSDRRFNALMRVHLPTGDTSLLCEFPNESSNQLFLHRKAIYYSGKIYFLPQKASSISIYDIEKNEVETIFLSREDNLEHLFSDGFIEGDFLWLFPGVAKQPVLKVDLKGKTIYKYRGLEEVLSKIERDSERQIIFKIYKDDNYIYFALLHHRYIVRFDYKSNKSEVWDTKIEDLYALGIYNKQFFFSSCAGGVYQAYEFDGKINEIPVISNNAKEAPYSFCDDLKNLYIFSYSEKKIYSYLEAEKCFINSTTLTINDDNVKPGDGMPCFTNYDVWNSQIFLFPTKVINIEVVLEGRVSAYLLNNIDKSRQLLKKERDYLKSLLEKGAVYEESNRTLEDYVNVLVE